MAPMIPHWQAWGFLADQSSKKKYLNEIISGRQSRHTKTQFQSGLVRKKLHEALLNLENIPPNNKVFGKHLSFPSIIRFVKSRLIFFLSWTPPKTVSLMHLGIRGPIRMWSKSVWWNAIFYLRKFMFAPEYCLTECVFSISGEDQIVPFLAMSARHKS